MGDTPDRAWFSQEGMRAPLAPYLAHAKAVRSGDLKYVRKVEGETTEWLFDLASDIGEKNDLSKSRPGDVKRLKKLLGDWEKDVRPLR